SLSLSHAVGAVSSGGMDALLNPTVLEGLAAHGGTGQQFEAQVAYGLPLSNDQLTLTPGLALALSPDSATYRLLWSLVPYSQHAQGESWEVSLAGERQESNSTPLPEHSLHLSFSLAF
ncbi:MAG TPA: hypothetical protein DD643_01115, partial [Synechococcus sp. UBA8638]|nr:hypothetical protein [Synechococcus sp. UBA8638]